MSHDDAEARLRELEEAALAGGLGRVIAHDALEVTGQEKTWAYVLRSKSTSMVLGQIYRPVYHLTRDEALTWLASRLAYNARVKAEMAPVVAAADATERDDVHAKAVFEPRRRRA